MKTKLSIITILLAVSALTGCNTFWYLVYKYEKGIGKNYKAKMRQEEMREKVEAGDLDVVFQYVIPCNSRNGRFVVQS